jgi:hypothetical protein
MVLPPRETLNGKKDQKTEQPRIPNINAWQVNRKKEIQILIFNYIRRLTTGQGERSQGFT